MLNRKSGPRRGAVVGTCAVVVLASFSASIASAGAQAGPKPHPMGVFRFGSVDRIPVGATPDGVPSSTEKLQIVIALEPRDPAALEKFAVAVSTPTSREYKHYVHSSAEFAAEFGPTPAAIKAVEAALQRDGLHPGTPIASHLGIVVNATEGQLASAFHTSFAQYRLAGGRVAYTNTAAPEFPASVQGDIEAVVGLSSLNPLPQPEHESLKSALEAQLVQGGPGAVAARKELKGLASLGHT